MARNVLYSKPKKNKRFFGFREPRVGLSTLKMSLLCCSLLPESKNIWLVRTFLWLLGTMAIIYATSDADNFCDSKFLSIYYKFCVIFKINDKKWLLRSFAGC